MWLIKLWWIIFLFFGFLALICALGPVILIMLAVFCTFVVAPVLVLSAMFGKW